MSVKLLLLSHPCPFTRSPIFIRVAHSKVMACLWANSDKKAPAMAYFAAVAAFSINAATSGARERKFAWLPGSSMTCDWARFAMNRSRSGLII